MITKRRIMVGLKSPHARALSCRQMGMPLRSAAAVAKISFTPVRWSRECASITAGKLIEQCARGVHCSVAARDVEVREA
jgi:hypothetical protein